MKLSQGDSVVVTAGKDKGKKGTVMRVLKSENRVIVAGINMVTKHVKKTTQEAGKKIKYEVSISASNVAMIDPKTGKPTRIGYKVVDGKKVRIAKKSGSTLERIKVQAPPAGEKGVASEGKPGKKAPFWRKVGFGADAVQGESAAKPDSAAPAAPVAPHRSAGRGS